jgi:hypothetical protein
MHEIFKAAWVRNSPLTLMVCFTFICLIFSLVGLVFDYRHINGELAWIKPCKFSISFTVYALSLIWLSGYLSKNKKLFLFISAGAFGGAVIELAVIIVQVIRGTTSHFNTDTPFDETLWFAMRGAIFPVAFAIIVMYVLLLREKHLPAVLASGVRWGAFLTIIGLIPGILMFLPDSVQDLITAQRQFDGHTVGYAEGGPGLPWLGWSTVAGDLRGAHFVGLHALQVLPVIAFFIPKLFRRMSIYRQKILVGNIALAYLAFICLLTWQAIHGEAIVAPSMHTIFLGSILIIAAFFIFLLTLIQKPS